jgi:ABC-2 type transport system ATP-binding protein
MTAPERGKTPSAMVHANDLSRDFGEDAAVAGVSFRVERGEMFGIIGPDGAGKTTTLRLVLGLLAPHRGSVTTCGFDPVRRRLQLSKRIGYLSQRFSLYGDLSVDENVAFFAEVHGVRGWRPRRDELLEMLRLAEFRGRLADRLSGGMRQKLALACTLMHTPELLVLDEPTTGVDPVSRREFWRILGRLQRDGLTILVTTPYLDEAERCERVALMDHGQFLEVATPETLRTMERQRMVEVVARPRREALSWLRARPEVTEV